MPVRAASTQLSARLLGPDEIERGRSNQLRCPLYRAGQLVAPTSGTITIRDAAGIAQVDAAAVTITGGIATYSYTPSAELALGEDWQVVWILQVEGSELEVQNDAALVRRSLPPVVTDEDLYRRVPSLRPGVSGVVHSREDFQDQIDEAFTEIKDRLRKLDNRVNLILSPSALRLPHVHLTLALIYEDLKTTLAEDYADQATKCRDRYDAAWQGLSFKYDADNDGRADGDGKRTSPRGTLWLGSSR